MFPTIPARGDSPHSALTYKNFPLSQTVGPPAHRQRLGWTPPSTRGGCDLACRRRLLAAAPLAADSSHWRAGRRLQPLQAHQKRRSPGSDSEACSKPAGARRAVPIETSWARKPPVGLPYRGAPSRGGHQPPRPAKVVANDRSGALELICIRIPSRCLLCSHAPARFYLRLTRMPAAGHSRDEQQRLQLDSQTHACDRDRQGR